eukprot:sb/3465314/
MPSEDNRDQEPPKSPYSTRKSSEASSNLDEKSRLELAHELYMNENMQMSMPAPSSIYGQVKEIVHRAFWDSVREALDKTPPEFEHSLRLIAEIKEILLELVPAKAERVRAQINEVMDIELYKQQIEQGSFDLHLVAKFVVQTMLGLCAPARDATVNAILTKTHPVDVLKEVFGALDLIRLDFVNYQLKALRPTLLANSVQYEQSKFRSLLENNPSALDKTKNWISETARLMREGGQSVSPSNVLNAAFLRLLHEEVRVVVYQLCSEEYISHPRELLPHITEKCVDLVRGEVKSRDLRPEECDNVRGMLAALGSSDNPVFCLLWERAKQYLAALCTGAVGDAPSGFGVCRSDLQGVASKYTHLVSYNRGVYGPFYADIISEIIGTSSSSASSSQAHQGDTNMD